MASSLEDDKWVKELETVLASDCDLTSLLKLCHNQRIPDHLRPEFWQTCLGIKSKKKVLLDEFDDTEEQKIIRNDCLNLIETSGERYTESEKETIVCDLMAVISTFSKRNDVKYASRNGWLEILKPLIALKLCKEEMYGCFDVVVRKYIPKYFNMEHHHVMHQSDSNHHTVSSDKQQSSHSSSSSRSSTPSSSSTMRNNPSSIRGHPFHLLRLLLLYHDPQLCSFLDTKKISPESYAASWFRSLFSGHCKKEVTLVLWDYYFQSSDPFLIFFLSLVLLANSRDAIMDMRDAEREFLISVINTIPNDLEVEDVPDLFTIVEQHYVSRTPSVKSLLDDDQMGPGKVDLSQALCLPVDVQELLPNPNSSTTSSGVRYFVVDCRPPAQYNSGHLNTAFHLDCSLMLQDKSAFDIAVQALLEVQKQAIDANSVAGGHHLCFMGSGKIDEDSNVFMVVASFLQKQHKFVSLASGGYESLHHQLWMRDYFLTYLADHDKNKCPSCHSPSRKSGDDASNNGLSFGSLLSTAAGSGSSDGDSSSTNSSIFDKPFISRISTVVKSKFIPDIKEKLAEYMKDHSSDDNNSSDRSKFSLSRGLEDFMDSYGGGKELEEFMDEPEVVFNVDNWSKEHNAIAKFPCKALKDDNQMFDSFLILTDSHIYILREQPDKRGYGKIVAKRPLEMIVQITSKRKIPELITFKYGETNETSNSGPNIIATDCLYFAKPYEVTRMVKQQVINVLDAANDPSDMTFQTRRTSSSSVTPTHNASSNSLSKQQPVTTSNDESSSTKDPLKDTSQ